MKRLKTITEPVPRVTEFLCGFNAQDMALSYLQPRKVRGKKSGHQETKEIAANLNLEKLLFLLYQKLYVELKKHERVKHKNQISKID